RRKKRAGSSACWVGDQLERSGSALRQDGNGSASSQHGLPRRGGGVSRRKACGQGDIHDLVANLEENDRAGVGGARSLFRRQHAEYGNDRRVGTAYGLRQDRPNALLQPAEEDSCAGNLI